MKNKLDELEEYNQQLENQLNTIFCSISASAHRPDRSCNIGRHKTGELDLSIRENDEQDIKANDSAVSIPTHKTGGLDKIIREEGYFECEPDKDKIAPSLFLYSIPKGKQMTSSVQDDPEHHSFMTQIECLTEKDYLSKTNPTSEFNRKCNEK